MVVSDRPSYGSAELTRTVEEFAVKVALGELGRRYPAAAIEQQPRNNPGFDVLVKVEGDPKRTVYVEVKGTTRQAPLFFLTDGELQFSLRHADQYRLIVVHAINLNGGTWRLLWHEGAISARTGFKLKTVQWACERSSSESLVLGER